MTSTLHHTPSTSAILSPDLSGRSISQFFLWGMNYRGGWRKLGTALWGLLHRGFNERQIEFVVEGVEHQFQAVRNADLVEDRT